MEVWGWIVVYALGLTVLQLLVYRYLADGDGQLFERAGTSAVNGVDDGREHRERRRVTDDRGFDTRARPDSWRRTADGNGRVCPYCGVENEPETVYTRCWNCTRHLG